MDRIKRLLSLLLTAALLAAALPAVSAKEASMTTLYVSPAGDDRNPGTPCRTTDSRSRCCSALGTTFCRSP